MSFESWCEALDDIVAQECMLLDAPPMLLRQFYREGMSPADVFDFILELEEEDDD